MKIKTHQLVIPLAVFATAALGSVLTAGGMDWYGTIRLPSWTPPGSVIGAVWTVIFALAAVSAVLAWGRARGRDALAIAVTFALNGVLNVLWSLLFFRLHLMGAAAGEAVLLELSVLSMIAAAWPVSRKAAALLVPYAAWVVFATYLTYAVWRLNG